MAEPFKNIVSSVTDQAAAIEAQASKLPWTKANAGYLPAQFRDPSAPNYVSAEEYVKRAKLANLGKGDPKLLNGILPPLPNIKGVLPNIKPDAVNINHPIFPYTIPSVQELASGTDLSASDRPVAIDESQTAMGYKVRLFAVRKFPNDYVMFDVSPTLSESRSVEYATVAPIHLPGSIQIYKRTAARTFSLGAKFISRNKEQATKNIQNLQLLRGWTMPYFGVSDRSNQIGETTASMLGAPPDVLYLYAYSTGSGGSGRDGQGPAGINLKKIPVVITSLNIDYPEDCDYIPTDGGDPFPVKMEVKIDLLETHSPGGANGYESFSLTDFKNGRLVQF